MLKEQVRGHGTQRSSLYRIILIEWRREEESISSNEAEEGGDTRREMSPRWRSDQDKLISITARGNKR